MGFLSEFTSGQSSGFNPLEITAAIPRAFGFESSNDPVIGSFFTNPADEQLKRQMEENRLAMQAYRQAYAPQRSQALGQAFQLFGPANDFLAAMYGQPARVDFGAVSQPWMGSLPGISPEKTQGPKYGF